MVRLTFSLFLVHILSFSAILGQSPLQLGVRVGMVYTSFSSKEDFKPFYQGGLRPSLDFDAVYTITENIFLQTGLGYQHAVQQRLNFRNEFLGVRVPFLIGLDFKGRGEAPKLFPFVVVGGEGSYGFGTLHIEDGEQESVKNFIDPWQAGVFIGGGIKRNLKNDQQALIGIYSRLGLTGFPAGRSNLFLPKLWPFQLGVSLGWRWNMIDKSESKEDKS